MKKKELMVSKEPLFDSDTLNVTYGCRHTNPDICNNNSLPNICAFTSDDCICKKPPQRWKKMFEELSKNKKK